MEEVRTGIELHLIFKERRSGLGNSLTSSNERSCYKVATIRLCNCSITGSIAYADRAKITHSLLNWFERHERLRTLQSFQSLHRKGHSMNTPISVILSTRTVHSANLPTTERTLCVTITFDTNNETLKSLSTQSTPRIWWTLDNFLNLNNMRLINLGSQSIRTLETFRN